MGERTRVMSARRERPATGIPLGRALVVPVHVNDPAGIDRASQRDWHQGVRASLLVTMVLSAACTYRVWQPDPSCAECDVPPPRDVPVEAAPACIPNATGPSQTVEFAITQLLVDDREQMTRTVRQPSFGFNIDNVRSSSRAAVDGSPDCGFSDFTSTLDPDQNGDREGRACERGAAGCMGGVDNAFPFLIESLGTFLHFTDPDAGRQLTRGIRNGAIILVRVSEVDGPLGATLCDDQVTVRLYQGVPLFSDCEELTATGRRYAVTRGSLQPDSTDAKDALVQLQGAIVNGRLRTRPTTGAASLPELSFAFPAQELPEFTLDVHNVQLRVTLQDGGVMRDGNLGGVLRTPDLIQRFLSRGVLGQPFFGRPLAQTAMEMSSDLAIPIGASGARCNGDLEFNGLTEGGISVGMGFEAVPAVITNTVVDAPRTRRCGSSDAGL